MVMDVIGLLIVLTHGLVILSFVVWFGLGKPTTKARFVEQFKAQFLGIRHEAGNSK